MKSRLEGGGEGLMVKTVVEVQIERVEFLQLGVAEWAVGMTE